MKIESIKGLENNIVCFNGVRGRSWLFNEVGRVDWVRLNVVLSILEIFKYKLWCVIKCL